MNHSHAGQGKAILIAGPTASGKSALALRLARLYGGMVINADSQQVYRELAILSARPSAADEALVPHRLYGIVSVRERFSVAAWLTRVREALDEAKACDLRPIIVGGTGLYFKALLEGLAEVPPIPDAVRAESAALLAAGPEVLHAKLAVLDPAMAARLRPRDRQRLQRAYEVIRATGQSLLAYQRKTQPGGLAGAECVKLVLMPPRAELHAGAESRFEAMLAAGALAEAWALRALGVSPAEPAMKALGVASLLRHIDGQMTLDAAVVEAKTATRRYIKRQTTWFKRHMIAWEWLEEKFSEKSERNMLAKITPLIDRLPESR